MFRKNEQNESSACPPMELLLRHVIQPESLAEEQCEAISWHIAQCEHCAGRYEALCDANAELWEQAAEAAGIPEREPVATRTPQEALADLWRQVDEDEAAQRKQYRRAIIFRVGRVAAAACILITIGIGWLALRNGVSDQTVPSITTSPESPVTFAELVTDQGRKPLALNQPITAGMQPQEILLGGMHRVVMNCHTRATFSVEPQRTEGRHTGKVPYEIQLAQGELYVEVVPGNPFTVQTANARLDITGTKFDVVADRDKTELTLLKGNVRFSAIGRPQEAVSVTAGHASTITGRQAPSTPAPVDALATTAWARDTALNNAVALAGKQVDTDLSSLSMMSEDYWRQADLPDVDTLDYEQWLDEHRQGRLARTALAALPKDKAADADWIEVLMISGDIWQFHYDPKLRADQPLAKIEPVTITRLARYYGLAEAEILKALGLPDSILAAKSSVQGGTLGQQYALALRRWYDAVMAATPDKTDAKDDPTLFSLYASQYLAETRTAAYLWAKSNPEKARELLADKEYLAMLPTPPASAINGMPNEKKWLQQLHTEANAARSCVPATMEWLLVPSTTGCTYLASEQHRKLAELIAELTLPLDKQEDKEE